MRKLTKVFCKSVALSCHSRGELQRKDESVYQKCRRMGWLDVFLPKKKPEGNHPSKYQYKYQKAWKENNKQKYLRQQKEYREKPCTVTKIKIRQALYRSKPENRAKRTEYERRRKFLKYASRKLLTKDHIEEMKKIYEKAASMTKETGIAYHVDHIVPLKGETISGLHVPWNLQIIPASKNFSKGNSFEGWGG